MYRININIPVGMWVWKAVKKGRVCFRSMNLGQKTTESVEHYRYFNFFKQSRTELKANYIVQINYTIYCYM